MKRGESGLSFVVGIDKPVGMSSHDCVNRCRSLFGEKRIGHTGTLDPLASGALTICVGPATRLDGFLTAHDKTYEARIEFGTSTDTDDAEGEVTAHLPVPPQVLDADNARQVLADLVGRHRQLPPVYSAIKVNGVKSYDAARRGSIIDLKPRDIEIYEAELLGVGATDDGAPYWDARLSVSKGTYIRSIARDLGKEQSTVAHLAALRRTRCGNLLIEECVTFEALEQNPDLGRIDPIALLGMRFMFADERQTRDVSNGVKLNPRNCHWFAQEPIPAQGHGAFPCSSTIHESTEPCKPNETFAIVAENKLVALYAYDRQYDLLRSRCGFSQGVSRGGDI